MARCLIWALPLLALAAATKVAINDQVTYDFYNEAAFQVSM